MSSASEAVETLILEYGKLVFHTIYGLTGDWEESQDLTQDTFHQALRGIDAARAASGAQFHAKAWLLRIALNTVRMQRRRRSLFRFIPFSSLQKDATERQRESTDEGEADVLQKQATLVQPVGYSDAGAERADPAELIAERDAVQRTMAQLPEPLRICLLLSVIDQCSTTEIAELLHLQEPAVRQRLARARKQFQQLYALEVGEKVADPKPTCTDTTVASLSASEQRDPKARVEQCVSTDRPLPFFTIRRSYA